MRTVPVVVLAVVAGACGSRSAEVTTQQPTAAARIITDDTSPIGRLDERAWPTSYELALDVDPAADGFSGEVAITVSLTRPQRVIWLHGRDLAIDKATVTTADGRSQTARVVADERTEHTQGQGELLGLGVDAPVDGRVLVHVAYHAKYRSSDGMMRAATQAKLVFTDSEPNDARGLMPCFDDPRFKVPWTVSVTAPEQYGIFANYPEQKRTKLDGGRVRVGFQPTRPLPSYLIAVAVGELEVVPVSTENGVPIQFLLPGKGMAPYTKVIQDATPKLLADLVRVFDEPVPFPKLDMLVIPMDPGRGGMENPGLTTLAQHMVLVDPALRPERARRHVEDAVHVIAHELAHLWIGDLITIGNWGDLWLQEGGATWFGIRAARTFLGATWLPPFNRDVIDYRLKNGARPPIRMQIGKLDDANAMFRTETYAGGAAVFDALEAWLGEAVITKAVADLIDQRSSNTVSLDDFLAAIRGRAPSIKPDDLKDSLVAMLDAPKMPTVSIAKNCNPLRVDITVDSPAALPVCFDRDGGARVCTVVRDGKASLQPDTTAPASCPQWLLLNPGGGAPYVRKWEPTSLQAVLDRAPLDGRESTALLSELRTLVVAQKLDELSSGDRIAAAAWLASNTDASPMVVYRSVEALEAIERAAPSLVNRETIGHMVTRMVAKRTPSFLAPSGQDGPNAQLALWLARRKEPTTRKAAAAAVPKLVAAALKGDVGESVVLARAATGTAKEFADLRAATLAANPRKPLALRTLASFQFKGIVDQLRRLIADPKLGSRDAESILFEAARNPAAQDALGELLGVRTDLSPYARAQLGRLLCDLPKAKAIAASIGASAGNMLQDVERCTALRNAWNVRDLP